jgi:hypothetical protein
MITVRSILVLAAIALGVGQSSPPSVKPAQPSPRPPAAIKPAEASLIGTIDRFDESARRLVLQTKDGHVTFVLAADAVVRLGPKKLAVAELASHKGRRAKVRYTQVQGTRTAHWVVISSEAPKIASAF